MFQCSNTYCDVIASKDPSNNAVLTLNQYDKR